MISFQRFEMEVFLLKFVVWILKLKILRIFQKISLKRGACNRHVIKSTGNYVNLRNEFTKGLKVYFR